LIACKSDVNDPDGGGESDSNGDDGELDVTIAYYY